MTNLHFVFGNSGSGKTTVTEFKAREFRNAGLSVLSLNVDPVNSTDISKGENRQFFDLFDGQELSRDRFNDLIDFIFEAEEDEVIVDTGPFTNHALVLLIKSIHFVRKITSLGCRIAIHSVVEGGQPLLDSLNSFSNLADSFKDTDVDFFVWLNEIHGSVRDDDGKFFEEMIPYIENRQLIADVLTIPNLNQLEAV